MIFETCSSVVSAFEVVLQHCIFAEMKVFPKDFVIKFVHLYGLFCLIAIQMLTLMICSTEIFEREEFCAPAGRSQQYKFLLQGGRDYQGDDAVDHSA